MTPVPSSGFRVRPARRGDTEGLASLLRDLGYEDAADSQTLNWVISHPEIEILVAGDAQDRPVGMLSFSHRPQLRLKGRVVTIDELVVAPAWRRKGVGRALLNQAVLRARSLSVKRIELLTHGQAADEGVLAFCIGCGFTTSSATQFFRSP